MTDRNFQIVEVLGRSEQGATNPYICQCSNGKRYYVKGCGASFSSLVKEYISGNLALSFGLPIANFDILEMPKPFFESISNSSLADLGHGLVFGSEALEGVTEMSFSDVQISDRKLMADVFLFDWWVLNGDRSLSEFGGNPNLLWSAEQRKFSVIDFNLAFDASVTLNSLKETHVFRHVLQSGEMDSSEIDRYKSRLAECMDGWIEIVNALPERWMYADDAMSVPINFDLEVARRQLDRYLENGFWAL
jgi:hypothetical protein